MTESRRAKRPAYQLLLELKFQGQLDRARAADLVQRAEAAIRTAGAEAARQCFRRVAEQGAGQAVVGAAEVRMIKNVEELRAETKAYVFRDMKLTLHRNIRLRGSETAQDIAPEIPLLPSGRRSERRTIEDFSAGILRSKKFKRLWVANSQSAVNS